MRVVLGSLYIAPIHFVSTNHNTSDVDWKYFTADQPRNSPVRDEGRGEREGGEGGRGGGEGGRERGREGVSNLDSTCRLAEFY